MKWRSQLGDNSGERFGAPTSCWAWGVARKRGGLCDSRRSRCLGAVAGMEALGLREEAEGMWFQVCLEGRWWPRARPWQRRGERKRGAVGGEQPWAPDRACVELRCPLVFLDRDTQAVGKVRPELCIEGGAVDGDLGATGACVERENICSSGIRGGGQGEGEKTSEERTGAEEWPQTS